MTQATYTYEQARTVLLYDEYRKWLIENDYDITHNWKFAVQSGLHIILNSDQLLLVSKLRSVIEEVSGNSLLASIRSLKDFGSAFPGILSTLDRHIASDSTLSVWQDNIDLLRKMLTIFAVPTSTPDPTKVAHDAETTAFLEATDRLGRAYGILNNILNEKLANLKREEDDILRAALRADRVTAYAIHAHTSKLERQAIQKTAWDFLEMQLPDRAKAGSHFYTHIVVSMKTDSKKVHATSRKVIQKILGDYNLDKALGGDIDAYENDLKQWILDNGYKPYKSARLRQIINEFSKKHPIQGHILRKVGRQPKPKTAAV